MTASTRRTVTRVAALLLPLIAAPAAPAADHPVAGTKVQVKRSTSGKEKFYFLTKDPTVPFPAIGSADDPATGTPGGMTIEVFAANDPARPQYTVLRGLGKPGWSVSDRTIDSFKYANRSAPAGPTPVKAITFKQTKQLRVVALQAGYALTGTLGRVAVRVTVGSERSCAVFGAGATIKRDRPGEFLATNAPAPAIADCSDTSLGFAPPTTTTLPPPPATVLDFTTLSAAGQCGVTRDGSNAVLATLTCGGLNLGGGGAFVAESLTPDGGTTRFAVGSCTGNSCAVGPTFGGDAVIDCSNTDCNFGTPLPIPNGGTSTCVVNNFSAPASGTIDLDTGVTQDLSIQLTSHLYLTANNAQPCPRCTATGTPSAPGTGTCDRGARVGLACTTANSQGLTKDCPPGGVDGSNPCVENTNCADGSKNLGAIPVALSPLTTGQVTRTAPDGLFCPGQTSSQKGCFKLGSNCVYIEENGSPAGSLFPADTPKPFTMAAIFCIPTTTSSLVNLASNLPGPGATALRGTLTLRQLSELPTTTTSTTVVTTTGTTSSTTSTTTGTTTTSTTTTLPPGVDLLDFTTGNGSGSCGATRDAGNALLQNIACGGLDLGGGGSSVPEGLIPDGATNRFAITNCVGNACDLTAAGGGPNGVDCTGAGCAFGPPLPISNQGLSTCIVDSFGTAGSGTVDLGSGALTLNVPLAAHVFLTGNATQPCPRCSATGSAGNPVVGTCDRGARMGLACSTTNSQGLSVDCQPGGSDGSADLGSIAVDLSPLVTGNATKNSDANGLFCPGQQNSNNNQGCFGKTTCRHISVDGVPAGAIVANTPQPVTVGSAFCIPAVGDLIIDGAASLPGPGAASLSGFVTLRHQTGTTTTTTLGSTTTGAPTTSTTTTSTTSTTSTTLLPPLPPLLPATVEFASTAGTGTCGSTRNGLGTVLDNLDCGDLALGNGNAAIPPSALPDGAVVHFKLGSCSVLPLLDCTLDPEPTAGTGFDCTNTGCNFGPPVPIPNGGLSACAVSTFAAPASGSVNLLTGATTANVSLNLHIYLTGNATDPCPRCSVSGTAAAPGTGVCSRGARVGLSCVTTNSQGLSKDCQPGGSDGSVDVGTIAANLSPVTTGTATRSNPLGLFCPGQTTPGCFGESSCRSLTETGVSPGTAITAAASPQPATLVSTFCVPATGNLVLDGPAGLPGPAAISLVGTVRAQL